jgi:hypothetical protein
VGLKPPRKEDVLSGQGDARKNIFIILLFIHAVISRKAAKLY